MDVKKKKQKNEKNLKQLAIDIQAGRVFTSQHIPEARRGTDISLVFMPLAFMKKKDIEKLQEQEVEVVYEYLEKNTSKMAINGMPMFGSCGFLTKQEWKTVVEYIAKIEAALDEIE